MSDRKMMKSLTLPKATTLWLLAMTLVLALTALAVPARNAQLSTLPGTIIGILSYPSDYIPPMRVYAIASDGTGHYQTNTGANQRKFTIRNVPPGTYYVVAYTDEAPGMAGGWSKAVPCGLMNTCSDHSLIAVTVAPGRTTTGVRVFDWYAPRGAFPPEPSAAKPAGSVERMLISSDKASSQNICHDPAKPCGTFKPYELPFQIPRSLLARTEDRSAAFYAVILKTAARCSIPNNERMAAQALFPRNKVFLSRFECEAEDIITYSPVDDKYSILAVYAGITRREADRFLTRVRRTSSFPGAYIKKLSVVRVHP